MANQLLALVALAVVTTVLFNSGRAKYAPVTLLPMCFVASTTLSAAYGEVTGKYLGWVKNEATRLKGLLNIGLTVLLLTCVAILVVTAIGRWITVVRSSAAADEALARVEA
jgi:carbon starvation protein